jgi:hypothetical protein
VDNKAVTFAMLLADFAKAHGKIDERAKDIFDGPPAVFKFCRLRMHMMFHILLDLCSGGGPFDVILTAESTLSKALHVWRCHSDDLVNDFIDVEVRHTALTAWSNMYVYILTALGSWSADADLSNNIAKTRAHILTMVDSASGPGPAVDASSLGVPDAADDDAAAASENEPEVDEDDAHLTVGGSLAFSTLSEDGDDHALAFGEPAEEGIPTFNIKNNSLTAVLLKHFCNYLTYELYEVAFRDDAVAAMCNIQIDFASKPCRFIASSGEGSWACTCRYFALQASLRDCCSPRPVVPGPARTHR